MYFLFFYYLQFYLGKADAFAANYTVTKTLDNGEVGTLRWAIEQAGITGNGNIDFDSSLAGQTITLTSDLTGWDDVLSKATTLGDSSGSFTLTGLTDASGVPAITINGSGHRGIWATGSGTFSISNIKFTGFAYSDTAGNHESFGSVLTIGGSSYGTINVTNVVFDSTTCRFLDKMYVW